MEVADLKGKTIGLAASGGLDTMTICAWLKEKGVNVNCYVADLGQPDEPDLEAVKKRMEACGADKVVIVDAKQELALAGIEVIQTNARYEGGYWNTTGIARHVTTKEILKAMNSGEDFFSHGATGRGNDQVRFQLVTDMLRPGIKVYAPWRDTEFLETFGGRQEMIDWCEKRNLPIIHSKGKPYSTDANFLGLTHEAGELEYITTPAIIVKPEMGVWPWDAPDEQTSVNIGFVYGCPSYIGENSQYLSDGSGGRHKVIEAANKVAGRNGVGIGLHTVENRFVGIKSRGVYEAPGMELIGKCYQFLLEQILDRRARKLYDQLSAVAAGQIYEGYWYDPASQMIRAALAPINKMASGKITVCLYKGNIIFKRAEKVEFSLYSPETSSMENVGDFDHRDSEGFLGVLGVHARALAASEQID